MECDQRIVTIVHNVLKECERVGLTVEEVKLIPKILEIKIEMVLLQIQRTDNFINIPMTKDEYNAYIEYKKQFQKKGSEKMEDVREPEQQKPEQFANGRLILVRDEQIKKFLDLVDELKEMTDFLRSDRDNQQVNKD